MTDQRLRRRGIAAIVLGSIYLLAGILALHDGRPVVAAVGVCVGAAILVIGIATVDTIAWQAGSRQAPNVPYGEPGDRPAE